MIGIAFGCYPNSGAHNRIMALSLCRILCFLLCCVLPAINGRTARLFYFIMADCFGFGAGLRFRLNVNFHRFNIYAQKMFCTSKVQRGEWHFLRETVSMAWLWLLLKMVRYHILGKGFQMIMNLYRMITVSCKIFD